MARFARILDVDVKPRLETAVILLVITSSVTPGQLQRSGPGPTPSSRGTQPTPSTNNQTPANVLTTPRGRGGSVVDIDISISSRPRPLEEFAMRLQRITGVPISYEEPAWSSPRDLMPLVDTPDVRAANPAPEARPDLSILAPAMGTIQVKLTGVQLSDPKNAKAIASENLGKGVADHAGRQNPGEFAVVDLGESGLSIVPTRVHNSEGRITNVTSPLDTLISLPQQERSAAHTLLLIGAALSQTVPNLRVDTSAGGLTSPALANGMTNISASNEAARTVISRTLREIRYKDAPKFFWRLLYDVNKKSYTLKFGVVARQTVFAPNYVPGGDDVPTRVVTW